MILTQILAGLALFFGEALIISAEMWAAKNFSSATRPDHLIFSAFAISVIGVVLLMYGYVYGFMAFKNIWVVTAISIAGILIVEPLVAWFLFEQMPTRGAIIGLTFGAIGLIAATSLE